MAYILCLETSTTNCSVVLSFEGSIVVSKEDYDTKYSHAERLHLFINEVMHEAGVSLSAIAAVAVSKGPGSYTGLRIGVSAAKGLCYALGVPLIAIPTLTSLAHQVVMTEGHIIPMLDARRMEVYSCVFTHAYSPVRDTQAEILSETSFDAYLAKGKVYFIGNGVAKFEAICAHPNAIYLPKKLPSANEMAMLSYQMFIENVFVDVAYFEPFYLKDFVAG